MNRTEAAVRLRVLAAPDERDLRELARLLTECVEDGASVSFLLPMTAAKARAFWTGVADGARRGDRILVVAEDGEGVAGTVQVVLEQPENQPHRGDLAKMLVSPRARRRGVGAALLRAAEEAAASAGKTLLVLDTASADAERLYERGGWQPCGFIPDYALMPDGTPCGTRLYYKKLQPRA